MNFIKEYLEENHNEWSGTMKSLSETLNNYIELLEITDIKIPATPNRLSREINKLTSEFEKAGISVEMSKTINNTRYIQMSLEDD